MNCAQFVSGQPGPELPALRFVTDPVCPPLFCFARPEQNQHARTMYTNRQPKLSAYPVHIVRIFHIVHTRTPRQITSFTSFNSDFASPLRSSRSSRLKNRPEST